MHLLGVVHQQRGDSDKALKLIGAALELNDCLGRAFNNHGKVLLQLRRFDEALVSIERALALAPDQPQALINRATIRIEQRRFADALADTLRVLEKDPLNVDGWTKRGNVLAAIGERAEGDRKLRSRTGDQPGSYRKRFNNRGCLLGDIDRTEEALAASRPGARAQSAPCRSLDQSRAHAGRAASRGRRHRLLSAGAYALAAPPGRDVQFGRSTSCVLAGSDAAGKIMSSAGSPGTSRIPSASIRCHAGTVRRSTARCLFPASRGWATRSCMQACSPMSLARTPAGHRRGRAAAHSALRPLIPAE